MRKCRECGKLNQPAQIYCSSCGALMSRSDSLMLPAKKFFRTVPLWLIAVCVLCVLVLGVVAIPTIFKSRPMTDQLAGLKADFPQMKKTAIVSQQNNVCRIEKYRLGILPRYRLYFQKELLLDVTNSGDDVSYEKIVNFYKAHLTEIGFIIDRPDEDESLVTIEHEYIPQLNKLLLQLRIRIVAGGFTEGGSVDI